MAIKKGTLSPVKRLAPVVPAQGIGGRTVLAGKTREFQIFNTYVRGLESSMISGLPNVHTKGGISILSCLDTSMDMTCCRYSEEFDYICVGFIDGKIRLFKSFNNELVTTFYDKEVNDYKSTVTALKHRPLGRTHPMTNSIIATYLNGCVKCWNYNLNDCFYTIREKRQTYGLTYHPRMPKFITFGDDAKILMYDEETRTQERVFQSSENSSKMDGHTANIYAGSFNPKSNYEFVTGGWDDTVQFWDNRQPNSVRHFVGVHICADGVIVDPTGTKILTCAWQKQHPLQLWDYGSAKLIYNIEPDSLNSLLLVGAFLNDDYCVIGGGDPNSFRIFDRNVNTTRGLITSLEGGVQDLSIGIDIKTARRRSSVGRALSTTQYLELNRKSIVDSELIQLPKVAFISGRKLYQVDFH